MPQANNNPSPNIQSLGAAGLYGTYTAVGGGGGIYPRSELDAARMVEVGRAPQAQYPDGYLGSVPSRRGDRLLDSLKVRQNQKSYVRGVHKGERIDPADYYWPSALQPTRGLQTEARAVPQGNVLLSRRSSPRMELTPAPHLVNDGKSDPPQTIPGQIDPKRAAQMQHLRTPWR